MYDMPSSNEVWGAYLKSLGRYTDNGYSGHEDKEELMRKIDEMKRQLESM